MSFTIRAFTLLFISTVLSGCAGLFIAGAATTVTIVTDPRTTSEIWDDKNIEFEVAGLGNKAPYARNSRIVASSYRGDVVLMGQVASEQDSESFIIKTRELTAVNTVHNQLRIKPAISLARQSEDSWITTKIKSQLLADGELKDIKIKVITEDSEVFLFGYVTQEQARKATEVARNVSGVTQVIKAFQYGELE